MRLGMRVVVRTHENYRLSEQNDNSAFASRFSIHLFAVLLDNNVELPKFKFP